MMKRPESPMGAVKFGRVLDWLRVCCSSVDARRHAVYLRREICAVRKSIVRPARPGSKRSILKLSSGAIFV